MNEFKLTSKNRHEGGANQHEHGAKKPKDEISVEMAAINP